MRNKRHQPLRFSPEMASAGVSLAGQISNRTRICRSAGMVSLVCPVCGLSFDRKASEAKRNAFSYCGRACCGVAQRRRVITRCRICGASFAVKQSSVGRITCCSNEACNVVAHKVDLAQRTHIMWEKGRYGRGELHPSAKLSAAEHAHIIEDPRSHAAIAKEFGVTRSRVSQIKARNRAKESPQAERLGAEE